jgi:hypothetical protein
MEKQRRILLICSSIEQTVQMHEIAKQLDDCDCWFTLYRHQELSGWFTQHGLAHKLATTSKLQERCINYLHEHQLPIDPTDKVDSYDIIISTPDLAIRKASRQGRLVLIQNAMLDHDLVENSRENPADRLLNRIPFLARWLSSAADDSYDKLCLASDGYRDLYVRCGVDRSRVEVTGIPQFDNYASFLKNSFPRRDYALVVTSEEREAFHFESHRHFVLDALRIARGWPLLFRIPDSEKHQRTIEEIRQLAPQARILTSGDIGPMVANCGMLITQCLSVAFIGMALGKDVHSYINLAVAYGLLPLQNGGQSAANIARVCRDLPPVISDFKPVAQIGNRLPIPMH